MQKPPKPIAPQKPKIYLKFSDLGQLPEAEADIALGLLAQVGNEHFLKSEAELVKRLASNLSMVAFLKKQIAMELVDVAPLIAKLVSVEAVVCRYLREGKMTAATRPKPETEEVEDEILYPNNEDLFLDMKD